METILSLDIGNLIEGLFAPDLDIDPVIDAVLSGDPAAIFDTVLEFIMTLSQNGAQTFDDIDVAGGLASAHDIYSMSQKALFNEFDGFDNDGVGYFELEDADGQVVQVTAAQLDTVMGVHGIDETANKFLRLVKDLGLSPFEGMGIKFNPPIGNTEIIDSFGTGGNLLVDDGDGRQQIELVQETKLVDVSMDFESLHTGMMDTVLDLAIEGAQLNPQLQSLIMAVKTALALGLEGKKVLEEGIEVEMSLHPVELVTAATNAALEAINTFGGLMDELVPGDIYSDIGLIESSEVLSEVEGAISTSTSAMSAAFEAMEPLIEVPRQALATVYDLVDDAIKTVGDTIVAGVDFVGSTFIDGINTAIDLLNDLRGVGFTIDLLFTSIDVYPFRHLVDAPISILNAMKSVAEAGIDAVSTLNGFLSDIDSAIQSLLTFDLSDAFDGVLTQFGDFLVDLAEGASLNFAAGIDPFSATMDAGITLQQIAKFDPDEVEVTYEVDGFSIDTTVGDAVGMFAPLGEAGDIVEGKATYSFSGDVDYEYRLAVDFNPQFTFLGIDLSGALQLGDADEFVFDTEYALASTGTFEEGNLGSHFDEALLEIPFEFAKELMQTMQAEMLENLSGSLPFGAELDGDEFILFQLDDVEIEDDQFTQIVQDFAIEIV